MAIATQNLTYLYNGPTKSGQILQGFGVLGGSGAQMLIGYATFTGDAGTKTATLNYIDGTQALNFTPTKILAAVVGGTDTAGPQAVMAVDAANSAKTATVSWNTNLSAAGTSIVLFIILP